MGEISDDKQRQILQSRASNTEQQTVKFMDKAFLLACAITNHNAGARILDEIYKEMTTEYLTLGDCITAKVKLYEKSEEARMRGLSSE